MQIENQFTVAAPAEELWSYLLDVERVAPCMPGAELTEVIDDRNWKGTVHAKFGPVSMSFAGTVTMEERDDTAHRVVLKANGMEQKGKGARSAAPRLVRWAADAGDRSSPRRISTGTGRAIDRRPEQTRRQSMLPQSGSVRIGYFDEPYRLIRQPRHRRGQDGGLARPRRTTQQ